MIPCQLEIKYKFYLRSVYRPLTLPPEEPSQKHFGRLCKDSPRDSAGTSTYDFIPSSYCSKYRPSRPDKIWRKLNNFKRCNRAIGTLGKLRIARFPPPLQIGSGALKHGNRFVKWKRPLRNRNINGELNPPDVLIMIKAYYDSLYRLRRYSWLHAVSIRDQPFRSIITYHTILNR